MAVQERRVEAGRVIYREGEPGDALYVITEGEVEVLRRVGGEDVRLSVLRKGAMFGEMAVIRDRPRSTTVRALGAVGLMAIPKEAFLATVQRDSPLAFPLLRALCERLVEADRKLIEREIYSAAVRLDQVARVRLLPASPEVEAQIGTEGVTVAAFPFRVGRNALPGEAAPAAKAELTLRAFKGEQLSPLHFALEEQDGRLVLRDLDSHLGTLVNGQRVAHFEHASAADLRFGDNTVQAGGAESPYRFHLIVERREG